MDKRFGYTGEMIKELAAKSKQRKAERESEFPISVPLQENRNSRELYVCADSATLKGSQVEFKNATFSEFHGRLSLPKNEHKWFGTISLPLAGLKMNTAIGVIS